MSGFLDASKNIVYIQFVRTATKGRKIKKEVAKKNSKKKIEKIALIFKVN